jgi:colanic acid biosynthesis glycosyl transferase WcaI
MLHLSSFALSSLPVMALQTFWKPEIVFTVEPTFFAAPIALLFAAVSGAASWLHIQDFEVDAAFRLGLLPANGWLHALARKLETLLTGRFSRVSSISRQMVDHSTSRGAARSGTVLFPNWEDVEFVRPAEPGAGNCYRRDHGLEGKTVLLYAGNMGAKQGIDGLGPLVNAFSGDSRVHFLFCGEGPLRPKLEKLVRHHPNVTMLPQQPREKMNDLLNAADIHLLPQRREAADLVLPSKLAGIFSSGRPVIAIAERGTQLAEIVSGCGLVVPADDPHALHAAAMQLVNDRELRAELGRSAREYAEKHLSKERVLRRFEQDMLELVRPPQKPKRIELART